MTLCGEEKRRVEPMNLPKARESVILQQENEDFFLVDTEGGEVFEVNASAAKIFSLCRSGGSYDSAVAALSEGLRVPGQESEILADVRETVAQLAQLGLCEG
jgi:hypothetical protein